MIDTSLKEYFYNLYKKFYMNAGIMECFVKSLPFISVSNLGFRLNKNTSIQKDWALNSDDRLIILDIHGEKGLEYAYYYKDKYTIVPDFNMVCHPFGIVECRNILCRLKLFSDVKLKNFDKYMFVLDYNRYQNDKLLDSNRYNNQYEITEEDLPEVEMLKFLKISKISYICTNKPKEDIVNYLNNLKNSNISVNQLTIE